MSDRFHRPLAWLIAALMVAGVAAAPTVAQVYDPEAERVFEVTANADTVDGFSAIGATANKALRARKLVATNRYGQLPSNIIRPRWKELKGVPASFKDGVIAWNEIWGVPTAFYYRTYHVGYISWVDPTTFSVGNTATSFVIYYNDPVDIDFQILPIGEGNEVIVIEESFKRGSGDKVERWLRLRRHASSPSATVQFRIRVRTFNTDSTTSSKVAVRDLVKVRVAKRR